MSVKKIFYNTLLQSVGKAISVAIGLITIAFLTRFLGDEGFGEYTTVISFMGFFGILADLGLYLVTTKEISKEGADEAKILGNVFRHPGFCFGFRHPSTGWSIPKTLGLLQTYGL